MKAFRYNSKERTDRKFNRLGNEKNPNAVKFYARNMEYAENYRYIYTESGDLVYECDLEITEIENVNLFDMAENFQSLNTYKKYIDEKIAIMLKDYNYYMNKATKVRERKMWAKKIDELKNEENNIISFLFSTEFQPLSDFDRQNELVAELKALGFDGYITNNEIAIF